MRIKSYYAASVEAAMSCARRELGPDAMLVQSRKAPMEARDQGEYEVIFAHLGGPGQASAAASDTPAPLLAELAVVRTELAQMRKAIARNGANIPAWLTHNSPLADLYAALIEQEVDGCLTQEILSNVQNRLGRPGAPLSGAPGARRSGGTCTPEQLDAAVREELTATLATDAAICETPDRPTVLALVGPPGAGKTATLVKLAMRYGLTGRRSTQIFSVDTYRVGASEQLRIYAGILGVAFQSVESTTALAQGLEECRNKQLVLVDTPGFGGSDFESASELARYLSTHSGIETHLVLPASMKPADLQSTAERYEVFGARKLLFTKLDETSSYGPILNVAVRTGKPVSFLTVGQRIPEDLEPATPSGVIDRVLPEMVAGDALSAA